MDGSKLPSYTAKAAYEPSRHRERTTLKCTLLNLFPNSPLWSRLLGLVSLGTGLGLTTFLITSSIALIPSMLFSKYIMNWPSCINRPQCKDEAMTNKNTSNTVVGSLTALKTFAARSQMNLQNSGGPDGIAPLLIGHVSLFGPNIPGSGIFTQLYLLFARWHYRLTGRIFVDQLTEFCMKKYTRLGEMACLQARTCWLDDVVDIFAKENEAREVNVVILGAGYDTRCYRLDSIMHKKNVFCYEVDAPGTQQIKRDALKEANIDCGNVKFVSCDFESDDWLDSLQNQSNFNPDLPTVFVWEGVTMYLELDVVKSTISQISHCGIGSCIAFDYIFSECMNEKAKKSAAMIGEPWKCAIEFDEIDNIVKECQENATGKGVLKVIDHLRKDEMKERYLAKYNDGSYVGYLEDFGAFCLIQTQ